MNKSTLIVISLVLLVAAGGYLFPVSSFQKLGAEGDTNVTNLVVSGNTTVSGNSAITGTFSAGTSTLGNTAIGNGVLALSLVSSTSATSITAAQFCGNGVVTVTNDGSQTTSTLTMPVATSTFANCMSNLGSRKFLDIQNTSSSAFIVTIASSTGFTMLKPFNVSSTFTVIGGGATRLEVRQITSSTGLLYVERMQ